jgi:tetratricopeptide (TPR) repeat protein
MILAGRLAARTVLRERPVRCPYCDKPVPRDAVLCPVCGYAVRSIDPPERVSARAVPSTPSADSPGGLWYVALGLLASALLAVIVALGLVAAEAGLEVRRQRAAEVGQQYYERGLAHLEEGNYLLALAEFEEAVRLAPDNQEALEQYDLLRAMVGDEETSPEGVSGDVLLSLYGEASKLYAEGQWAEAIVNLEHLRQADPTYRATEVEEMLFRAYRERSLNLLELGELEEALSLLDKALELVPGDPDVAELHQWLSLYMAGLSQWGVDWEKTAATFGQLYELNPDFLDVRQRLHDALVSLGDLYYAEGAWCMAESQYGFALEARQSEETATKRNEARELCVQAIAEATPSSVASAIPAQPVSTTVSVVSPLTQGTFVGEFLGYEDADPTAIGIAVCVFDASGHGVAGAQVRISAYDWTSDPVETRSDGCCEFAGLNQVLEFTVELTQLPCEPFQITTKWGKEAQVNFVER